MSQTGTQPAEDRESGLREVVRQLVHDLRQPLGGIESLAYYFELALEDTDEELREQCARLRQLVAQASWMLEDAALAAQLPAEPEPRLDLNQVVTGVGERLARQEERPLRLALASAEPCVSAAAEGVRRWLTHALAFFHDVAEGEPMPLVETEAEGCGAWLRVHSQVGSQECLRALDPPGSVGGLHRLALLAGGRFHCATHEGRVTVGLWLPVADHALDEVGVVGA